MKRIIFLSAGLLLSILTYAQTPESFNYQAVVRDDVGELVTDQQIYVRISILQEGLYNEAVYVESHITTTNPYGLFTIKVGSGTIESGYFGDIQWGIYTYFLQTEVDVDGGGIVNMGMTQIVSVPYAQAAGSLILTDDYGNQYKLKVDGSGSLSTQAINPPFICGNDLTDNRDGRIYPTVKIGQQCWLAKNLNIGNMLQNSSAQIDNGLFEKYCYANLNTNCDEYGGMYTWDEMMAYSEDSINQGICPEGWLIPTDYQIKMLEGEADSQYGVGDPVWNQSGWRGSDAGGNLKETGETHWLSPNTGATNSTGFTLLGSGIYDGSSFSAQKWGTLLWTSSEFSSTEVYFRNIDKDHAEIGRGTIDKDYALPVRCVKNEIIENGPPAYPGNPSPYDGFQYAPFDGVLSWSCSDPDGDQILYDIYFGTASNPPLVASNSLDDFYDPGILNNHMTYYWRIIAHDYAQHFTSSPVWSFKTFHCGTDFLGYEGKDYATVQIGDQCWMAENMAYLPEVSPADTGSQTEPYYYVYDYNGSDVSAAKATTNYQTYGVLYNWQAAMELCPEGWHLPTYSDFVNLAVFLETTVGGKLKEAGTEHWASPNTGATNESGFTALPGGQRTDNTFNYLTTHGHFWSSKLNPSINQSNTLNLFNTASWYHLNSGAIDKGNSVRCIRD